MMVESGSSRVRGRDSCVALASIQALHAEVEQLRAEKAALQTTMTALEKRLEKLEAAK